MAKLNGTSSLPTEAQAFLDSYKALLKQMTEAEATEATINLLYKSYYSEMGGVGAPPEVKAHSNHQATGNVTALKRPPASTAHGRTRSAGQTPASRGADIRLPRRGLCRLAIFLAVTRAAHAPSKSLPIGKTHRQDVAELFVRQLGRRRRQGIGAADRGNRGLIECRVAGCLEDAGRQHLALTVDDKLTVTIAALSF